MPTATQLDLLPIARPSARFQQVPLAHVEATAESPAADFTENIARVGVVLPVALVAVARALEENEDPRYVIADGRRRVAALRRLEMHTVPAMVFPPDTPLAFAAAVTLSTNFQRRANPIAELEAIESLMRQGRTEEDVAEALRLSVLTIRSRLRMSGLRDYLRAEMRMGTLSLSAATVAARVSASGQREIWRRLRAGERVTTQSVRRTYFPTEDLAQEAIPLAETVVRGREIVLGGWDDIMRVLELVANAIPQPGSEDTSMEAAEVWGIVERVQELIELCQPFGTEE